MTNITPITAARKRVKPDDPTLSSTTTEHGGGGPGGIQINVTIKGLDEVVEQRVKERTRAKRVGGFWWVVLAALTALFW